ncbi:hypothetical protein L208DRAFT_1270462, partial [Tricholoma matsutake]
LIAKSVIKQFDIPKAKTGEVLDDALEELIALANEIEVEERLTRESANEDDDLEDDNEEGWIDEQAKLSKEDQEKLNEDVQPVRLVLVKISLCKMAYAIKNSSTIILPKWYSNLNELELKSHIMPRDITTQWNSTYDMLDFALKY